MRPLSNGFTVEYPVDLRDLLNDLQTSKCCTVNSHSLW